MQPFRTLSAHPIRMRKEENSRKLLTVTPLWHLGMMTEKSCNLLEHWVHVPRPLQPSACLDFFLEYLQLLCYKNSNLILWMKLTCRQGYSKKKYKQVEAGEYNFLKTPWNLRFVTLTSEIMEKTSFYPPENWKFCKIVCHPLKIPKVKNQDPRKFHVSFSLKPQKLWTLGFLSVFLWSGNFMSSTLRPHIWIFSGIVDCWKCLVWKCNKKYRLDQWAWAIRD